MKASDISPNLDRDKMFKELWWLNYCFCYGQGLAAIGNPSFGSEAVALCLHAKCQMTDVGNPFCGQLQVMCCITQQCNFPPAEGSPICVCFNKKLAGADGWSGLKLFDWSANFQDTFWIYYLFCAGCGVSGLQANGRPLYAVQVKEFCIKEEVKLSTPCEDGVWCAGVGTQLCFWSQLAFPPASGAPKFVCCNIMNPNSGAKPMGYGA